MADQPDPPRIFRNALEERAVQIVDILNEPELVGALPLIGDVRSFDYKDPTRLVFEGREGGRALQHVVNLAKSDPVTVDRQIRKAIDFFYRSQ